MNVLSRPKLRGVIHLIMSPLALVAGLTLITITSELRGRITLTIFTLTAVSLFICSAIYHRVPWSPAAKAVWRRIDHANIPLLIAGTYTPFSIYLLEKNKAVILLSIVCRRAFIWHFPSLLASRSALVICTYLSRSWLGRLHLLS